MSLLLCSDVTQIFQCNMLYFAVPKNPIMARKKKREFSAKAAKTKWDALEKCVSANYVNVLHCSIQCKHVN